MGYVVALDFVPGSGTWDPSGVKTWWYAMGTYNDHGGARRQEVQKGSLARFALCPGDSAELVIGVYGSSNGGLFQKIANGLAGLVNDIKNKLPAAGIQQGGALGAALAVGGPRAAGMLSSLLRSNGENCFVGSVRVTVVCDQRGNIRWSYAPQDSAWDMGRNPQGTYTIGVGASGGRPEYWFKVGVRY